MSGPNVEQTAEPGEGAVLAPSASLELESACHQLFAASPTGCLGYDEVAVGLEPFVAALVAAAEERGAAKERERADRLAEFARRLLAMDDPEDVLARAERQTVTLDRIIGWARFALDGSS